MTGLISPILLVQQNTYTFLKKNNKTNLVFLLRFVNGKANEISNNTRAEWFVFYGDLN